MISTNKNRLLMEKKKGKEKFLEIKEKRRLLQLTYMPIGLGSLGSPSSRGGNLMKHSYVYFAKVQREYGVLH